MMFEFLDLKKLIHYRKFKVFLFGVIFLFNTLNAETSAIDNHLVLTDSKAIRKHAGFTIDYIKAIISDVFQYQLTNSAIAFLKELLENDKYYSYLSIYRFLRENSALLVNTERFYKVIHHQESLEISQERQSWHSDTEKSLSESIKALQIRRIPTHPDPKELYEVISLLDSLPHDFESMDKIAQGIHHLLAKTTLIDKQNSLIREIFIDRRLKLYIENLNGEEKFEFIALLYEKILPVPMQHRFKKQIPNRDLNQYTGNQLIEFIETYISIYEQLFSFHHEYTRVSQYALFNLEDIKDLKISSITLDDMSSFLEIISTHNKKSNSIFIETVAQKIVYLILNTDLFLNKENPFKREDSLYSIFYDHLNAFYLSLSPKNNRQFMQDIARQIKDNIKTSPYFESLLEKEIQNPLLSFQDYIKIFSQYINDFVKYREDFIDNKIKEPQTFIQPRKIFKTSPYHVLSVVLNLTPHKMHTAVKQLNYLFLNTYITRFSESLIILSEFKRFSESLSSDENKQFKKLIVQEMIESIDFSYQFKRFLEQEKFNPILSIEEYFRIYEHLIKRYYVLENDETYHNAEFIPSKEYPLGIETEPEYHATFNQIIEIKNLLEGNPQYEDLSITEIAQKISQFLTKSDFLYVVDDLSYEYLFKKPFKEYCWLWSRYEIQKLLNPIYLGISDSLKSFHGGEVQRKLIFNDNVHQLIEDYRFLIKNTRYSLKFKPLAQGIGESIPHKLKILEIEDMLKASNSITSNESQFQIIENIINLGFYTDYFFVKDEIIKNIFFKNTFQTYLNNFIKTEQDEYEFKRLFFFKLNEKLNQIEGFETLKDSLKNILKFTHNLKIIDCMDIFKKIMEEISYQRND